MLRSPAKLINYLLAEISSKLPLRVVLIVPFILQIFTTVAVIGYLSFINGKNTVNYLVEQLENELIERVEEHLINYLKAPHQINQINIHDLKLGEINLENINLIEHHFWQQIKLFESATYIYVGTEKEVFIGAERTPENTFNVAYWDKNTPNGNFYTYAANNQGDRTKILSVSPNYDLLTRPWYRTGVEMGKPSWGKIYLWAAPYANFALPAVAPVYDAKNNLEAVFAVDLSLIEISKFLRSLKIGKTGEIFIIERDGMLVATSTEQEPFINKNNQLQRISADEINNIVIRDSFKYLQDKFVDLSQIDQRQKLILKSSEYQAKNFIVVTPYQDQFGLDWLMVMIIPENDFMAQIHANNRTTLLLCIIALIIATTIGFLTADWVTKPILQLNETAKNIAQGNWKKDIVIRRNDELGELSESFNKMAEQLQDYVETLEDKVISRTAELAVAKKKAETANKAKSIFIAHMSHELRTPLNAILGFSQIMTRSQTLTPEQQENISIIYRSGEYLLSLINNVLDFSKIEANKTTLNVEDFDLNILLNEVEELLQIKAENKSLYLKFDNKKNLYPYIKTDRVKLKQVLINLINNAIKFTTYGGVSLKTSSCLISSLEEQKNKNSEYQKGITSFEIEDTGDGISPEELNDLFEPFHQTATGRNTQEGTGLGLPISRKFVQLMGGDITVESQVGIGSIFRFNIIVEIMEAIAEENKASHHRIIAVANNQNSYKILIVDDKLFNRKLLTKILIPLGFEIKEAINGEEAVSLWETWQPHLICMDLRMPIMDGYEAIKQIRKQEASFIDKTEEKTKIIAVTASTLEEEKVVVMRAGFDDFVRKPFREEIILTKIAQHLGISYVYAPKNPELPSKLTQTLEQKVHLQSRIKNMPPEWVKQLYHAAIDLDEELILSLIEHIPQSQALLASFLLDLVNQCRLDKIVDFIENISDET